MDKITSIDDFKAKVLHSKLPVVVDFYTEWCGPCKMLSPILEELAKEKDGEIYFCKIDADQQEDIRSDYEVEAFPTILLIKDGKELDRKRGVLPKPKIERWLNEKL